MLPVEVHSLDAVVHEHRNTEREHAPPDSAGVIGSLQHCVLEIIYRVNDVSLGCFPRACQQATCLYNKHQMPGLFRLRTIWEQSRYGRVLGKQH